MSRDMYHEVRYDADDMYRELRCDIDDVCCACRPRQFGIQSTHVRRQREQL